MSACAAWVRRYGNAGGFALDTTDSTGAPTDDELSVDMAADGSLGMLVVKMYNFGDLTETTKQQTVYINN